MGYLVRKIAMGKWAVSDEILPINADAITQCLKTDDNTLSVWRIENEQEVSKGVLAMAASNDFLSKIDVVIVDESELTSGNITIETTPGKTPCTDLVDSHRDLAALNVNNLAFISESIAAQIRADKVYRFTATKIKALLLDAINSGSLNPELLSDSVREKVLKPAI
jgi:hypothetical protein